MMGLLYIIFFAVYVLVSLLVILLCYRYTKRRYRRGWIGGVLSAFVIYNLVFWDWVPTVVAHKYYCATDAGFWIYKTLDQWNVENPGVAKTLVANKGAPSSEEKFDDGYGRKTTYYLNSRFTWVVIHQDISDLLPIIRTEQQVKDVKKNEVLARYVDFGTGNSVKSTIGPPGPLKFWLHNRHCLGGEINDSKLAHYFIAAKNINEKEAKK